MGQNAVVKEIVSEGVVRVSLMGQMQCGSNCDACKGCIVKPAEEVSALASDGVGVHPGDWVEVESVGGNAIRVALLIFVLPCVGLLLGYIFGGFLGLGEGQSLLTAAAGLLLFALPAVVKDRAIRKRETPEFTVLGFKRD